MGLYINFTAKPQKKTDFKSNSGGVVFWSLAGIFGVLL